MAGNRERRDDTERSACGNVRSSLLSPSEIRGMGWGWFRDTCWTFKKTGNTGGLLGGAEGSLEARGSEFSKHGCSSLSLSDARLQAPVRFGFGQSNNRGMEEQGCCG